ncbi:unnamed protein product [Mytilus edulis]|uniref:Uncharacterized protein n=1 Tax=Mytilus edulis TaxID=6550 RepID=A0A8S3PT75_MYTED|nr:unnamed protein product [Mytilus edulis]
MACSGIVKPESKGYYSFPESGHFTTALSFVNSSLAENLANTSKTGGSKFSGFGPASYPGRCRSKDFEIHGSSLGMSAPNCDRAFSSLLGSKPLDGLRLSQASYVKSENNLRCLTFVLETAEHFLSAAGSLLKDKGEEFSDLRSMLLQVDKSLGMSQFLLLGTVANFTLAKRQEILDKSTVSEALQQRLVSSPLSKDKLFSVSLEQLQEELNKAPPVVKVDVKVTDGKRFVKTTQVNNPSSSHQPKASTSSSSNSQPTKRPAFSRPNYSSGKKAKVVKGKKQVGGRLSHFLDQWALITSDKWVLSILRRGLELQFLEQPPLSPVPINLSVTKDSQKNQLLQDEVNILIQKGVLEETVVSYLHTQAVLIHSYLDDSLIKNHCRSLLEEHTNLSILLLLRLGFLISWEKSEIIPSQSFNFLGEHFRTDLGLVLPPEEKVVKVRQLVNALTQFSSVPARQLLQLVGFLISIMDVIPLGRLHIRPIQWYLSEFWHPISQLWEAPVPILPRLLPHLQWWLQEKHLRKGVLLDPPDPSLTLFTDASLMGWGAYLEGRTASGLLVRCSVGGTHQSSRDESCVSFSPSVSGCDSGSVTTGCHGQLHSSGLSSESRGDPFLFSVSSEQGNSSSVSQSRYNSVSETCSRQSKSSGGCSLPFPCSSEHRMGNSSISVSGDHSSKKTASRSGESPSARLVVVRDSLRKGGFSEGATKRISGSVRQSTGAVYDSKWSIFCTWCLSKQINPLSVTVQQLADFFLYLFEEKALATGRRRSEIHALSISESCLRFASDKSSVTLLTDPSFLAKNQLPDKGSGFITIPALPPTADNQVLCPVRALLVYLASSAKLRSAGSSRLFIPIKKGISDISAKTISTWICNTVILAYKSASSEVLVKHQVKAHEVRALASSWNIFNSSSMSEIMSTGFWRSDSAFYNHYLRSMPLHCDNLYSLGPLVAAQQVVFPPPSDGDSALR